MKLPNKAGEPWVSVSFGLAPAEIVRDATGDHDLFAGSGGLRTAARKALEQVSPSNESVTVASRVLEDAGMARRAFEMDASYMPARRAFAESLARGGKVEEALQVLNQAPPATRSREFYLSRARLLLSLKHKAEALADVRRSETPGLRSDEMGLMAEWRRQRDEIRKAASGRT